MTMLSRLRQILMVGGIESLGVVLGGIAGLLIVNVLPKDQYAAYTFLVACMTLMLGITDTGLAHCCLPVVGQRAGEKTWVAAACEQVFRKRWYLLFFGFFIVVPYWVYSTRQYGWSGAAFWLASGLIVAVLLFTLREHYANQVLMILGHISTLNRNAILTHTTRIGLVCVALLLPLGAYQLSGVVGATAASALVAMLLGRRALKAHEVPDTRLPPDQAKAVDAHIFKIARPLMLPAVFYQFQGIITVFIVSLFGTSDMLAEVGAFGRLSMILMVFDRVANVLLFPAIARAAEGERLRAMVTKAHLAYLGMMALVFLSAVLLPQYWMLLLGSQYKDRESLVWMAFLATLLMNSAGFAFRTIAARGYTVRQTFIIPFVLLIQVGYLWLFGANDLPAVLGFNVATCLANFLYQYAMLAGWFADQKRPKTS
jgi:O-antigen/teichoic acid export membrane protein